MVILKIHEGVWWCAVQTAERVACAPVPWPNVDLTASRVRILLLAEYDGAHLRAIGVKRDGTFDVEVVDRRTERWATG